MNKRTSVGSTAKLGVTAIGAGAAATAAGVGAARTNGCGGGAFTDCVDRSLPAEEEMLLELPTTCFRKDGSLFGRFSRLLAAAAGLGRHSREEE